MKFSLGEIAEHVGRLDFRAGELVEIVGIGPFNHSIVTGYLIEDGPADYAIKSLDDGGIGHVNQSMLRKRPDDQPFTTWAKDHLIPYADCAPSLEETMKTAQKNLASYTQEGS